MEEEPIEMCRVCMETQDGTKFLNIFEHFVNNELLVNLIHDLSSVLVELNDSIPYACEACVNKLTEFERMRTQIRESDRILKGAFTHGYQSSPIHITESEPKQPDSASELGLVSVKDEVPDDSDAILVGMKVEFLDPELETLRTADEPKVKRTPIRSENFHCCMCPKSFKTKAEQLKHASTEHTKFRYNYQSVEMVDFVDCAMCGRKFQNEKRLRSHQYRFTTFQQCEQCGEILPNNSAYVMQKHLNDHHATKKAKKAPKDPQFTCDICNKKFQVKKSLKIHMEEHSDKDFMCPECGKVKRTLTSFKNHMKLHQLNQQEPQFACEKPFKCEYCDATFADLTDRRRHTWQHFGKSPYHCRFCDKMMLRNDQLLKHEAICESR